MRSCTLYCKVYHVPEINEISVKWYQHCKPRQGPSRVQSHARSSTASGARRQHYARLEATIAQDGAQRRRAKRLHLRPARSGALSAAPVGAGGPAEGQACHRMIMPDQDVPLADGFWVHQTFRPGSGPGGPPWRKMETGFPSRQPQCVCTEIMRAISQGAMAIGPNPIARLGAESQNFTLNRWLGGQKRAVFALCGVAPGKRFWHGPADLRQPFWAGLASFLSARRPRRPGRRAIQDLRQIR